ncbi:hypothetical protein [Bradyrhizobium macuxiense]|nr:hypothetical protein [Bradyrhizobium macuxiense]
MTTAALACSRSDRMIAQSLLAGLLTVVGIGGAVAQSPAPAPAATTQRPPFAISGWRYERRADTHLFRCEQPQCGAGSKVSYRFYTGGNQMTLDQFRDSQNQVIKALEQRTPGQRITLLGVDGDKGSSVPRMYKARRLTVTPGGASEYQVNGLMLGAQGSASLISSARDEKASNDNYAKFAAAVKLVLAPKTR